MRYGEEGVVKGHQSQLVSVPTQAVIPRKVARFQRQLGHHQEANRNRRKRGLPMSCMAVVV